MLNSSLWDYSVAYILVQGTIIIAPELTLAANSDNNDKEVVFKDCALFADFISEINNIQIGNAKDIDVFMPINNSIEYSDNYSKALGSLWQYCRYKLALTNGGTIAIFHAANNSALFNLKQKITGKTADGGTKNVK